MRASRLLSILILLQLRGRLSAQTLADEFEVTARTIYRDIDQLSAAGVPVYAERGRSGGFALHDGYRTRLTGFTRAEAEALALAGVAGAAADLGRGAEAAAAQLKLLASLPADSGASLDRVAQRFHVDPVAWYARAEQLDGLPAIAEAVWRETPLRIRYESWKGDVTRRVDPLGLVLKGGVWYLVAAVGAATRTYRVSNIHAFERVDGQVRRPRQFDLARYWAESAAAFERRLLAQTARIRVSPRGRTLLRDYLPVAGQAVEARHTRSGPDGWVIADIPVEEIGQATAMLLRFGADIEVLGPAPLRAAMATEARRVAALYRTSRARKI